MSEQAATTETTQPSSPSVMPADVKAELDQQMQISLKDWNAPPSSTDAPVVTPPVVEPPVTGSDPFGIFKEKFGYESPEVAIADIESLRAFKAAPPQAELKFENEVSKQVAEALQAGKLNEVYEILDQQMRIDRLTTGDISEANAADIVKLGMQLKYKDLTAAEIDYKFKKQYGIPAKPALMPAEYEEEYNVKVAAWEAEVADKKMELLIDAKLSRPDLQTTKAKLVFPTIQRPQETEFQEWQKTLQEEDKLAAETTKAYQAFSPKSLETKLHFKDEPNKIDFEFTHEPDPKKFQAALDMVGDINKFWQSFTNPDGTPDRQRFLKTIYSAMNLDEIILQALQQSKNATIKAGLPDNSTGGLVRQMPTTQEPNGLDKMMRISLRGHGPF